ncbi:MAG: threonylcarbamoyl-AMP synthase [Mogibacterium sp.]|nr:threonylcarbamoyl-AMP synthase [Mogibacterium sp.]
MNTEKLEISSESIQHAGDILRKGGLVAFPTETVYGLGADALNGEAVKAVYAAKGRPSDNPMIVHIAETEQLADLIAELPAHAGPLIRAFWPGPITFVFRKTDQVPETTTGGLDTVAIRMPSNETARRLILAAGVPVAAPSANLSGKPSPTTAADVLEDMDGRIDAVLLGEDCAVGIESTVLDLTGEVPMILRPGFITKEMLETVLGSEVRYDPSLFRQPDGEDFKPRSPGMKYKHYTPNAEVRLIAGEPEAVHARIEALRTEAEEAGRTVAVLDYRDPREAAKDFFARLREIDREGVDLVLVRALKEEELGLSVMNRMLKSAGYNIEQVQA